MKMILKLGGSMIAAMAISAIGCSKSGVGANVVDATRAVTPPVNSATPIPSLPQSAEDKMPRISAEEAKKLVADGKAIIIDVRGTDAYNISHIKGALDIAINKLESGDLKNLPKDKQIIAYCS
ncbi:MAG TPA: rhodanese-like domain-containing protein [Blastocatellia bacterium]|nr:rhodanese-like domain-containing protein [Blastocatellia bacterium]